MTDLIHPTHSAIAHTCAIKEGERRANLPLSRRERGLGGEVFVTEGVITLPVPR